MSIFKESEAYHPFRYPFAIEAAKEHAIDMFWDVHQIDLQDDIRQYHAPNGLTTKNVSHEDNKATIDALLPIFTELDRTVADGYIDLLPYVKNNEIRVLLLTQAQRETVHQRGYALLKESLGSSDSDWVAFNKYKSMVDKIELMKGHDGDLSKPLNFAKHLTRVLLGEGVGLFAAFTLLLNKKRTGHMMGFNDVNEWSLSDETFHVENNIRIVQLIVEEDLSYAERLELRRYTLELADAFEAAEMSLIDTIYDIADQEDLPKKDLEGYIRVLKNTRLYQLNYLSFEEVGEHNVEWMDWLLSAEKHDAFFEKRVSDYSHGGLKGEVDYSKYLSVLASR